MLTKKASDTYSNQKNYPNILAAKLITIVITAFINYIDKLQKKSMQQVCKNDEKNVFGFWANAEILRVK